MNAVGKPGRIILSIHGPDKNTDDRLARTMLFHASTHFFSNGNMLSGNCLFSHIRIIRTRRTAAEKRQFDHCIFRQGRGDSFRPDMHMENLRIGGDPQGRFLTGMSGLGRKGDE